MKVNEKSRTDSRPSTSRIVTGVTVGAAIGLSPIFIIKEMLTPISDEKLAKNKQKIQKLILPIDTFENIKKYADDIILKTGLRDKGVRIQISTPESLKINPLPKSANFLKRINNLLNTNVIKSTANGTNAFFRRSKNVVTINDKGLYSAVFHEIGHALNFNNSKFMSFLQKNKTFSMIGLPIVAFGSLLVGLFDNKESKNKKTETETETETVVDFIHDNAGKLTFATFLPVLIEEGMASIKGVKLAKPYLDKVQHQLNIKNHLIAFSSYLQVPIIFAGAVVLGLFAKDKIIQHEKSN